VKGRQKKNENFGNDEAILKFEIRTIRIFYALHGH